MAETIITPFNPSPSANFQFQATLDGNTYTIICTWNPYALRYYVNFYDLTGVEVLSRPLVGSPDDSNISLTAGYFDTTVIYRDSRAVFEIPGLNVTPVVVRPPAPPAPPPPPPPPPRTPYRFWRLVIVREAVPGGYNPPSDGSPRISGLSFLVRGRPNPSVAMTSNTTPAPLVASASSQADDTQPPWQAFQNGLVHGKSWIGYADPDGDLVAGWVQIDFGEGNEIGPDQVAIAVDDGPPIYYPVDFQIQSSNTGLFRGEQATILSVTGLPPWPAYAYLTFDLPA